MPTYRVTDPKTGKTVRLTGDSPPTEQELEEVFAALEPAAPAASQPPAGPRTGLGGAVDAAAAGLASVPGMLMQPIPGIGRAVEAVRTDIPEAIVERTSTMPGPVPGLGVAAAGTIGTVGEMLPKTGLEALMEAATPGVGGKGAKLGGQLIDKAAAPMAAQVTEEAAKTAAEAAAKGITARASAVTQSKSLALIENVINRIPFIGGKFTAQDGENLTAFRKWRDAFMSQVDGAATEPEIGKEVQEHLSGRIDAQIEALRQMRDNMLGRPGKERAASAVGQTLKDMILEKSRIHAEKSGELYQRLGQALKATGKAEFVGMPQVNTLAKQLLEQEAKLGKLGASDSSLTAMLEALSNNPGTNYDTLSALRSELGSRIASEDAAIAAGASGQKFQSSRAGGVYKRLQKELDKDLEAFSTETGGEIKRLHDLARSFYREGKQVFDSKAVRAITKAKPDAVIDMIVKPGRVDDLKMVRGIVGEEGMRPLRRAAMEDLFGSGVGEAFKPEVLTKNMSRYTPETLSALFDPATLNRLKMFEKTGHMRYLDTPAIQKIAKSQPEAVALMLLKPGANLDISKVQAALSSPEGRQIWKKVQERSVQKTMEDVLKLNNDVFSPEAFLTAIDKNREPLERMLGRSQLAEIESMSRVAKMMTDPNRMAGNPSGTAQLLITAGAGAAGTFALFNPATAAKVLIPSWVAAKMLTSPLGRRYLTKGFSTKAADNVAALVHKDLFKFASAIAGQQGAKLVVEGVE